MPYIVSTLRHFECAAVLHIYEMRHSTYQHLKLSKLC